MPNTLPSYTFATVDPAVTANIIEEVRLEVMKSIIRNGVIPSDFGDLVDFCIDDFVPEDIPDEQYSDYQSDCDDVAFAEFHRIRSHLRAAFDGLSGELDRPGADDYKEVKHGN